tara:strand:- start:1225 stop:2682 length:1458 start_codon:yes stop_codon:yes gene_type:complete
MIGNIRKKFIKYLPLIIIYFIASTIRFYNLNGEDFWTDEIFAFYTAEPDISFSETLVRTLSSNFNCLFDFFLKIFHSLVGYDVYISRYFTLIIGIASVFFFSFLLYKTSNYNVLILGTFLISINIYHIKYSQELRSYILTFFLSLIFYYLNFANPQRKNDYYKVFYITIVSILMVLNHAFTLLILGSLITFKFLKFFYQKQFSKYDLILSINLFLIIIFYFFIYLPINISFISEEQLVQGISPHWMEQLKPSFFTNYFFSQYFGSRILGLLHLIILIALILKFKNNLLLKFNMFTFFVILLFLSYFVPVVYSFLFGPVLLGRFLIFLLPPIIFLISYLLFELKNNYWRNFLIFLICFMTLTNHILYENSFKQFYTQVYPTKPEVKKALDKINETKINNFTINDNKAIEKSTYEAYENYFLKYVSYLNYDLDYFNYKTKNLKINEFWIIYIKDTTNKEFELPVRLKRYKIKEKIYFNSLELILLNS